MSCSWSAHAAVDVDASAAAADPPPTTAQRSQFTTAKAFLQSLPSGGVYTCARAIPSARRPLVLWRFHLARLALGLLSTRTADDASDSDSLVPEMQRVTTQLCESVTRSCAAERDGTDDHLMITALWWRDADARYHVSAHACVMPTVRSADAWVDACVAVTRLISKVLEQPTCMASTVLVYGGGRENPRCKHTEWISTRVPLEERTSAASAFVGPIHETVLSRYDPELDETLLLEGLITNFFVGPSSLSLVMAGAWWYWPTTLR